MSTALREPLTERLQAQLTDLRWPAAVAMQLETAGVSAWLAGGFIRDTVLGVPSRDLDVVVAGDPLTLGRELARSLDGSFVPLDPERGIVRIVLPGNGTLDLTAMRGGSIEADLGERDFTIDAIAVPFGPPGSAAIDPFYGVADLQRKRLRLVSDRAFRDDGLRLLRAARLTCELDLTCEGDLIARARAGAAYVRDASPERQRDELARIFATDHAARGLRMLDRMAVLEQVLPEVTAARGVGQPREHYYDVFEHSIETVAALGTMLDRGPAAGRAAERLRAEFRQRLDPLVNLDAYFSATVSGNRTRLALIKLGALLHDVAKPETKAADATGRIRFFGHPELGAERSAAILGRLRFSNREAAFVGALVREHLRPAQLSDGRPPTDRAISRFFRDLGDAAVAVLVLSLADHVAARGPRLDQREYGVSLVHVAYLIDRQRQALEITPLTRLLTGDDLITELRLQPGPVVGRLLRAIEDAQSGGDVRTREQAMSLAREALTVEP